MSDFTTKKIEEFWQQKHNIAIALELPESVYKDFMKRSESFLQQTIEEAQEETATDICAMTDLFESQAPTSLEQWKEYKRIRNAIRDKYVLQKK